LKAPSERRPEVLVPAETLNGLRILVVDDNQTNRQILQGMLSHWGAQPTCVQGAAEALHALDAAGKARKPFALVLTDLHMPDIDGFELVEAMRRNPETFAVTAVMLTSAGHPGDAKRARELVIPSYLYKPVRKQELLAAILRALGHTQTAAQHQPSGALDARTRPHGLHILLTEDNRTNQAVATRMLEKMGHSFKVANNGEEALSMLTQDRFDLVLMDIQMPGMDGLTATKEIREREKGAQAHMPIIAMTAHAMKGDRERCIAGGMDGYVSKPIKREELETAIAAVIPQQSGSVASPAAKPREPEPPTPPNAFVWDRGKTLERLGGDEDLLQEVVEIFLHEVPKHTATLGQAITEGDMEAVNRAAHTLKGELGYLGILEISQKAREIEECGEKSNLRLAASLFTAFETEVSQLLISIGEMAATKPV